MKQSDVSQAWNVLLSQKHGDEQNWPQLTWESKKCNRLRYKLETKWDTRMFDVEKLVQETYELAEIETTGTNETTEPTEATDSTETVECKLETFDFPAPPEHRLSSSHGLASDTMMDLDPVEPMQAVPQTTMQQAQWPVTTDISQSSMNTDVSMDAFGGFTANMNTMSADFTQQPVSQSYHQPSWPNAGFVSTPDLVSFQQPAAYMNYTDAKVPIQVPTSQYATFVRPTSQHTSHHSHSSFAQFRDPRQSVPPNFLHHSSSTNSRRYVPKLINIASSSQRMPQPLQDQPPPPPPKDDHRFSRISMKRRPSNISQHTIVSHRDVGWNDECNWG